MNAIARHFITLCALAALPATTQAAACDNGSSAGFACSHIEFVGHLSPADMDGPGEVLNDIWGWMDPDNGDEYAIIGMQDGTAFVRIHDNGNLEFLGRLAASDGDSTKAKTRPAGHAHKRCHDDLCGEEDSAWRDIKVYSNAADDEHFAYVVSEAAGHGLQIFDLTALRAVDGDAPVDFAADLGEPYYGYYDGIGHAHNVFVNEDTARVYVVGHNGNGLAGGLHILSIGDDPMDPEYLGEADSDGYTHDVQCVVYDGPDSDVAQGSEICFASNEDTLTVWDVTDAANPSQLARVPYGESGYTHQGWLSDNQRHFFLNDELDEIDTGSRTHLRVFDVSDVSDPRLAADYHAPTLAIDHNNYVHGRWLYQSNYGAGLRVLDIRDPEQPVEAGFFDPQASDDTTFYGTWSNFRFPSGITAFTDIYDGLYVVRPLISEAGTTPDLALSLSLASDEAAVDEEVAAELVLSVDAAVAAGDVLLTLHLPAGAAFADLQAPAGWDCDGSAQERVQHCRADALAADSAATFSFGVSAAAAGDVEVIAMAYADAADAAPADNLVKSTLRVTTRSIGGGGGGGGALLWLLAALVPLAAATLRLVRKGR